MTNNTVLNAAEPSEFSGMVIWVYAQKIDINDIIFYENNLDLNEGKPANFRSLRRN